MDDVNEEKITNPEVDEISEEEKTSEAEALAEVKDDELKAKVAEELGINPEDEPELIAKAVDMKKADLERTSKAIKQKISWREKANKAISSKDTSIKSKDISSKGKPQTEGKPLTAEEIDKMLDERDAKRDLQSLGLSEEIETEVKDLAKVKGISVREAAKLPYIVSVIEEAEKAKRVNSASPKRKSRGNYANVDIDPSKPLDYKDFALDTKEGQKAWAEAKTARRQYGSAQ